MVHLLYPSTPGERAFTPLWIGGWLSLRAGEGDVEKKENLVYAKLSPSFSHVTCSVVTIPAELSWLLICLTFVCNSTEGTLKWNLIHYYPGHISCCKTQISNTVKPVFSTGIFVYTGVWNNPTEMGSVFISFTVKETYTRKHNIFC
jgi:hypothetical protein